jgi:hypothetical protein
MGRGPISARRIAAVFAVAVAVVAAGCGGDDEPTPNEAAGTAAGDFAEAMGSGDFDGACRALTEELLAQLGGEACPEQIGAVAGDGEVAIVVTNVRVSGPKAVAETSVRRAGEGVQESSFELVEHEDEWLVSGFGD